MFLGFLFVLAGIFLLGDVFAATAGASDGQTSIMLSKRLYCDTKSLIEGNLGILLGLLLVIMGIWSLIRDGSWTDGLIMIIFGALVTALPGLLESTYGGLGDMLKQSGITQNDYKPIECGGGTAPNFRQTEIDSMNKLDEYNSSLQAY